MEMDAKGVNAAAIAAFEINDLLDEFVMVLFFIVYQVRPFKNSCICSLGTGSSLI